MATSEGSKPVRDLSKGVKERIAYILQQDIEECGKVAQYVRKRSQSREVNTDTVLSTFANAAACIS